MAVSIKTEDNNTYNVGATAHGAVDATAMFPPNCPILYYNATSSLVAMGTVVSFQENGSYSIEVLKQVIRNVPPNDLQFAPGCPVWVLPWKKSSKWKRASVLGSYQKEDGPCYYSVCELTSTKKLIHHAIPLERIQHAKEEEGRENAVESTEKVTKTATEKATEAVSWALKVASTKPQARLPEILHGKGEEALPAPPKPAAMSTEARRISIANDDSEAAPVAVGIQHFDTSSNRTTDLVERQNTEGKKTQQAARRISMDTGAEHAQVVHPTVMTTNSQQQSRAGKNPCQEDDKSPEARCMMSGNQGHTPAVHSHTRAASSEAQAAKSTPPLATCSPSRAEQEAIRSVISLLTDKSLPKATSAGEGYDLDSRMEATSTETQSAKLPPSTTTSPSRLNQQAASSVMTSPSPVSSRVAGGQDVSEIQNETTNTTSPPRSSAVQSTCEVSSETAPKNNNAASVLPNLVSPDRERALIAKMPSDKGDPLENTRIPMKKRRHQEDVATGEMEAPIPKRSKVAETEDQQVTSGPQQQQQSFELPRRTSFVVQSFILPAWLDFVLVRERLVGQGGRQHKMLQQKLGCLYFLDNQEGPWRLKVKAESHQCYFNSIIPELENILLTVVSAKEQSLLLYDLARINGYGERYMGFLKQRSRFNSNELVWMCRVPFPHNFRKFYGLFIGKRGTGVNPMLKATNCTVDIPEMGEPCGVVFGADFQRVQQCVKMVQERLHFSQQVFYGVI